MRTLRILQRERNTDNIRIGAAFHQGGHSLEEVADDARRQQDKLYHGTPFEDYHHKVTIVDAETLEELHVIYQD